LKAGYRYGYPKIPLPEKIKGYIMLVRPFTLMPAVVAGLFGVVIGAGCWSFEVLKQGLYVGITLALAQSVGQIVNQVVDAELDKEIKPYRPIPRGWVTKDEAMGLAWLMSIVALGRAFTVTIEFGLWTLLILVFAVFYSLPPLSPRKVNPFLNLFWMAFSRGFLPFVATVSIYGSLVKGLMYGVVGLLWCYALQGTKDIGDAEGDRKYGIKTVFNTYGYRGLKSVAYVCLGLLLIYIAWVRLYQLIVMFPIGILAIHLVDKQSVTENNLGWTLFYVGLGLIYLLLLPIPPFLKFGFKFPLNLVIKI